MKQTYVIGMDFGTGSVRALLVEATTGQEVAVATHNYKRWEEGLFCDSSKSQFRHHPLDYIEGLKKVLTDVISQCPHPEDIKAISVDTTGSTPCLVDKNCTPLSLTSDYENNPDAMFVLWKDHTSEKESEEITKLCAQSKVNYAKYSGNHYSSECFWAKILHLLRSSEQLRKDAWAVIDSCDWIPALLTGCNNMESLKTGNCIAGAKMMWAKEWGGYPPEEFFQELDPILLPILQRLPTQPDSCDTVAGTISKEWAELLGLPDNVLIGVGNIDSHSGAVGTGIEYGTIVLNLGTSACYMALMPPEDLKGDVIEGIFGQVDGSIIKGMYGLEAGLSAFGDVYAWFKDILAWPLQEILLKSNPQDGSIINLVTETDKQILGKLTEAAINLKIDENTPLATDYLNGRRSPHFCADLTASLVGLKLSTTAPELFYAFAEATAFASKNVLDYYENNGVVINRLIGIGGISQKSPFIMQLLADATGRTIEVSDCDYSCALGSVIHAATIANVYPSVKAAQDALCPPIAQTYYPNIERGKILAPRYEKYHKVAKFAEQLLETK